jgi:hypothetical protein
LPARVLLRSSSANTAAPMPGSAAVTAAAVATLPATDGSAGQHSPHGHTHATCGCPCEKRHTHAGRLPRPRARQRSPAHALRLPLGLVTPRPTSRVPGPLRYQFRGNRQGCWRFHACVPPTCGCRRGRADGQALPHITQGMAVEGQVSPPNLPQRLLSRHLHRVFLQSQMCGQQG